VIGWEGRLQELDFAAHLGWQWMGWLDADEAIVEIQYEVQYWTGQEYLVGGKCLHACLESCVAEYRSGMNARMLYA